MGGVWRRRWQRNQTGHSSFLSYPHTVMRGGNKEELRAILVYPLYLVPSERNTFYLKKKNMDFYLVYRKHVQIKESSNNPYITILVSIILNEENHVV